MGKVLITGGSGFIGQYLCRECDKNEVDYLSLSTTNHRDNPNSYCVNLLDFNELKALIGKFEPSAIIHLAAIASPVHNDITEIYKVNVCGTENLLNAAAEMAPGARVVLASTAGVYGQQDVSLLHEGLNFNPVNHYSFSKMITEILSRQFKDRLDISIVRPFNIIGLGQNENFFIPKLVKHFTLHAPRIELGNLDAVRDYVSVDFCAKVLLKLAVMDDNSAPIVNICTGIGHSCRQVIEMLKDITGEDPDIVSIPSLSRGNEIWQLVGSTERLNTLVEGEFSSQSLHDVLVDMIEHYTEHN